MAAPTYVSQGAAAAVTSTGSVPYPATVTAGNLLLLFLGTDGTAASTPAGWTSLGSAQTGGGVTVFGWKKIGVGTEGGTNVSLTGITGGTPKGVAHITQYAPATAGRLLVVQQYNPASDTDTSSTAFTASGSSWTLAVDNLVICSVTALAAAAGTFSAINTGVSLTQAGATITSTARFAARTQTNTMYYGHIDGAITAGGTGAPTYSSTAVGANAGGSMYFVRVRENVPPVASFTHGETGLQTSVNGTGSTDSDGTIASYSWDWGDATALGSGSTATHTYAAGGTYTVALTVTDSDGVTNTSSQSVTVTNPSSPGPSAETIQSALRRVSGTTLDAQGAANAWAGTSGLDLLGALNTKAGNARGSWVGLNAVLNQLAGTTGLDAQAAADAISA